MSMLRKNSFLIALLGLSFLCVMLSGQARADGKGIPFNSEFSSALYPVARTVSGCTDWRRPAGMGDEWSGVSFAGACQLHDRCYHTLKSGWGECNQRFQEDLRHACDRDLEAALLERGKAGKPDGQATQLCYEISNMYVVQVQTIDAAKRYEFSQRQQAIYIDYVRKVVGRVYSEVLQRKASDREIERALLALEGEHTLDDLKTALLGSKVDLDKAGPVIQSSFQSEGY